MSYLSKPYRTALKEKLKADYDSKAAKWGFLGGADFTTTDEIANTEPFLDEQDLQISFKKSVPLSVFEILIASAVVALLFAFVGLKFYYSFFVSLLFIIPFFRSRREQLRVDQAGIWSIKPGGYMAWKNIVDTYIEYNSEGEENKYHLITWYYNSSNKYVESHRVNITKLNTTHRKVAFSIEYNKMRYGQG